MLNINFFLKPNWFNAFVDIFLGKKYSLFWVYGADNEWTYNFTKSMTKGMKKQVRNENDHLPDVVKNPLLKVGIKTYN